MHKKVPQIGDLVQYVHYTGKCSLLGIVINADNECINIKWFWPNRSPTEWRFE